MQLHPTSGSNKVVCMYYEVGAYIDEVDVHVTEESAEEMEVRNSNTM